MNKKADIDDLSMILINFIVSRDGTERLILVWNDSLFLGQAFPKPVPFVSFMGWLIIVLIKRSDADAVLIHTKLNTLTWPVLGNHKLFWIMRVIY